MELKGLGTTLLRRWYFVVAALGCAAAVTFAVVNVVGPTYEAEGSVLVFPPVTTVQRESQVETQGNPYLVLNGVNQARDIVIRQLTANPTRERLAEGDPSSSFEATPDFTNSAPIILVTAEADTPDGALSAVASVMAQVPATLKSLQSSLKLPASAVITSKPLIADTEATTVRKGQIRAAIVAAVTTLAFCLLLIGLIDGLLMKRRRTSSAPSNHRPALQAMDVADQGISLHSRASRPSVARRLGPRAPLTPGERPRSPSNGAQGEQIAVVNGLPADSPSDNQTGTANGVTSR